MASSLGKSKNADAATSALTSDPELELKRLREQIALKEKQILLREKQQRAPAAPPGKPHVFQTGSQAPTPSQPDTGLAKPASPQSVSLTAPTAPPKPGLAGKSSKADDVAHGREAAVGDARLNPSLHQSDAGRASDPVSASSVPFVERSDDAASPLGAQASINVDPGLEQGPREAAAQPAASAPPSQGTPKRGGPPLKRRRVASPKVVQGLGGPTDVVIVDAEEGDVDRPSVGAGGIDGPDSMAFAPPPGRPRQVPLAFAHGPGQGGVSERGRDGLGVADGGMQMVVVPPREGEGFGSGLESCQANLEQLEREEAAAHERMLASRALLRRLDLRRAVLAEQLAETEASMRQAQEEEAAALLASATNERRLRALHNRMMALATQNMGGGVRSLEGRWEKPRLGAASLGGSHGRYGQLACQSGSQAGGPWDGRSGVPCNAGVAAVQASGPGFTAIGGGYAGVGGGYAGVGGGYAGVGGGYAGVGGGYAGVGEDSSWLSGLALWDGSSAASPLVLPDLDGRPSRQGQVPLPSTPREAQGGSLPGGGEDAGNPAAEEFPSQEYLVGRGDSPEPSDLCILTTAPQQTDTPLPPPQDSPSGSVPKATPRSKYSRAAVLRRSKRRKRSKQRAAARVAACLLAQVDPTPMPPDI
eukprot:jgi/Mesvir1/24788/Mv22039-RA.1